jgi:adenosylcobyric acid synthase
VLAGNKALVEVTGTERASGLRLRGFEMHIGRTTGADTARPMLDLDGRPDGAISADGSVMGTYLHGIFADDAFRHAFLHRLKAREASGVAYEALVENVLDELADHLERHVDLERILDLASRRAR